MAPQLHRLEAAMRRNVRLALAQFLSITLIGVFHPFRAEAVPAFAKQTGQACSTCHTMFPELTPYGRWFKLSGYTIGKPFYQTIPVALIFTGGASWQQGTNPGPPAEGTLQANEIIVATAGKVNDYLGFFILNSTSNFTQYPTGITGWRWSAAEMDIRLTKMFRTREHEVILGLDLNNGPMTQEVSNAAPVWNYPYISSPLLAGAPGAPILTGELLQQTVGFTSYAYFDRLVYAEAGVYRTASGFWNWMRYGRFPNEPGAVNVVDGYNPYWRLAINKEFGPHSVIFGTYGMQSRLYPDNTDPFGATNRFTDVGVDAQYQYIVRSHIVTLQANYIWEKQRWLGSIQGLGPTTPSNVDNRLETFGARAAYWYDRKYGASAYYFQTTGSKDVGLYGITNPDTGALIAARPNTNGVTFELDWNPMLNVRFLLQYTGFFRFNGTTMAASDNNLLFFGIWLAM
jgi:hypothetical protein